jgi:hypothetical protein
MLGRLLEHKERASQHLLRPCLLSRVSPCHSNRWRPISPLVSCLQSLTRSKCPICRTEFVTEDIRRIHIDHSPAFLDEHLPSSPRSEASESERSQVKQFQESITRIVRQGDTMSESSPASDKTHTQLVIVAVREKIDEIRTWLKNQDRDEVCLPRYSD